MWFIRTNKDSHTPEMLHISSRETRDWIHNQIDFYLQKQGLLNGDNKPEATRADMAYLRQSRLMMQQIKRALITAFTKALMGGALGFLGWAIIEFIGDIK